jgi:hypothetical protein
LLLSPTTTKVVLADKLAVKRLADGVLPELDACFAHSNQMSERVPPPRCGRLIAELLGDVQLLLERIEQSEGASRPPQLRSIKPQRSIAAG